MGRKKLILPFDNKFVETVLKPNFVKTTYDATQIGGQIYGFPIKYYQWGFFYRKSLFQKMKIIPPETWSDFLKVCETFKRANISATAIGARDGWPAVAWFDYLNLRINGIEFHRKLLRGDAKFTDPRVRKVFSEWKVLLDKGYFLNETMTADWDSVLPYLYREKIGMALMGGFVASKIPDLISADIGFFQFPRYSAKMPLFEEAPLDILVLPASGQNRESSQRFLDFLARSDALNRFNESLRTVSTRNNTAVVHDPLLALAKAMLEDAAGITFFFDRDARIDLVNPAFRAFKKFLMPPYDAIIAADSIHKETNPE